MNPIARVQQRAPALRGCSAYLLRPHIFAGASVENYLVGDFRGTPNGRGDRAAEMRAQGKRLPRMLPYGKKSDNRIQFVHVDDVARLMASIVHKTEPEAQRRTMLMSPPRRTSDLCPVHRNLASPAASRARNFAFKPRSTCCGGWEFVAIPPRPRRTLPASTSWNTDSEKFLGDSYPDVIRYTIADAFADCFKTETPRSRSSLPPKLPKPPPSSRRVFDFGRE